MSAKKKREGNHKLVGLMVSMMKVMCPTSRVKLVMIILTSK